MGVSILSVIILILKIILALILIVPILFALALLFGSIWDKWNVPRILKRLSSTLTCPSCNQLFGQKAIETAKNMTEQLAREVIEGAIKRGGSRVNPIRYWYIICSFCSKAALYDPVDEILFDQMNPYFNAISNIFDREIGRPK